jgi:hypothetical protein
LAHQDIINVTEVVIPAVVVWPQTLQTAPNCLGQLSSTDGTLLRVPSTMTPDEKQACIRSCRAGPFYFRSWESSLAWAACGVAPASCAGIVVPYFPDFQAAAANFTAVFAEVTFFFFF